MSRNVLVTGGAGFIGSNFLKYMINKYPNDLLVCLDDLTYAGNLNNLDPIINNSNFVFVKGNICNKELVNSLFNKYRFDIVINLAAETHVDRSINNPDIFYESNIIGTTVLLDACLKFGKVKFHQVSTDEVYGDLPLDSKYRFTEESILRPSSPYSSSKASADLITLSYFRTYGLPVTISRCSNNFGPNQHLEKLIPLVISKALNDEKIPVYGTGLNIRDWIYVDDHSSALDLIIDKGQAGQIYNVSTHNEKTNLEIIKQILEMIDKPESLINFVSDRPGHDRRYALDSTKLEKLGWTYSNNNLNMNLQRTIDSYLCKFKK